MKLGLIGKNIGYSYSKYMHEEMARVSGINLKYNLIDIPDLSKINEIIENYDGLNVTIPYKQEVMKYVDEIDHLAKKIGSVNTIVKRNGKTYGYNTDYEGFLYSINSILDDNMKKALIIGAGGAAKAVYCCLKDKGIETFITNRNER